jgi:hypothetical protein
MSLTYEQRCAAVERVLTDEGVTAPRGDTLTAVAVKVLAALDNTREHVR